MRMLPSRYVRADPALVKGKPAAVRRHVLAPLKGLSLETKKGNTDPLLAPILDNWIIEEGVCRVRPGYRKVVQIGTAAIESLVPFYGSPNKLAAATSGKLFDMAGTEIATGFTSDDWSWTAFSNLSATDYTVMCNGADGVWSWDGLAVVEETITAPSGSPHIIPANFAMVLSHMNRLWFADKANLAVYYLPIQTKSGEVKELPLNALFRRGGSVRALYTWTVDGGTGLDDKLVIFSSNGEAVIYNGVDPDTDMQLDGIYRFDSPMSHRSVVNYGGELYCLISTGLVPMSTLMRAESEQLGTTDKAVTTEFSKVAMNYRDRPGWEVLLNHSSGLIYCNMPLGAPNKYRQMVRFMPNPIWASWSAIPSRCWNWVDNRVFFGSDDGGVYELHPAMLNDAGNPITVDMQMAWSMYGTVGEKKFNRVRPYIQTDGTPRPWIDVRVDYDTSPPTNQPDISTSDIGSTWDEADWDTSSWAGAILTKNNWQGVAGRGVVGSIRLRAAISNCEFAVAGFDVEFEVGT